MVDCSIKNRTLTDSVRFARRFASLLFVSILPLTVIIHGYFSLVLAQNTDDGVYGHPDAGTVAFSFLNMGYDARTIAMSGASTAISNGLYGALSNPAAVATHANRSQFMGGYRQIMADIWGGSLGISFPTDIKDIVFAPHLVLLTTGRFDIIDESGFTTGQHAASSYTAGGISAAKIFNNYISAGVTVKGIYHYIGAGTESYSAVGVAFDCGIQYRKNNDRLIYGAVLRNFGVMRGYWNEWNEYAMPYGIEAGVSYVPRHIQNMRAALDINKYKGDYMNFEPGFEYTLLQNILFIRGGYAFSSKDLEKMLEIFQGERDDTYQKSNINTLSLGIGIAATMDNVDMKLDAAMQFNSNISAPSIIISVLVAF